MYPLSKYEACACWLLSPFYFIPSGPQLDSMLLPSSMMGLSFSLLHPVLVISEKISGTDPEVLFWSPKSLNSVKLTTKVKCQKAIMRSEMKGSPFLFLSPMSFREGSGTAISFPTPGQVRNQQREASPQW